MESTRVSPLLYQSSQLYAMNAMMTDNSVAPELGSLATPRRTACVAAMSGGVDSAVATALAVHAGLDAVGLTMRLWTPGCGPLSEKVRQCCGPTAYEDARDAASVVGIPHYIVNFENAFSQAVIDYFCDEYMAGRTPNPCVACNNLIKFGALLEFVRALGMVTLITGHYARLVNDEKGPHLLRARDRTKDQSYMLAGLHPDQLASVVLPLGDLNKEETRSLARDFALGVAEKPDSMDLCFVDNDYRSFILQRFPDAAKPGPVMTTAGQAVGRHDGLLGYTVGQRKGLPSDLADGPWYVVRTDRQTNSVIIGRREELAKHTITCSRPNLIRPDAFECGGISTGLAVCRYRGAPTPARARLSSPETLQVDFLEPVPVVTPGQLLVLYDTHNEEVLASGIIEIS